MTEVGSFEAKNTLSALLERAEHGEEIVITRRGRPVAKLVPYTETGKRERAEEAARGAAFLCQIDRQARLIFLAFGEDGGSVRLFEESEVPENLSDLGWSYARVLSHLPFARAGRWQIN